MKPFHNSQKLYIMTDCCTTITVVQVLGQGEIDPLSWNTHTPVNQLFTGVLQTRISYEILQNPQKKLLRGALQKNHGRSNCPEVFCKKSVLED